MFTLLAVVPVAVTFVPVTLHERVDWAVAVTLWALTKLGRLAQATQVAGAEPVLTVT